MNHISLRGVEMANGAWGLGPITAELGRGCVALLGTNGAGKSTLMRALAGLQKPTAGQLHVLGKDGLDPATRRDRNRGIGYVPQDAQLPSRVTLRQLLEYAAWLKGVAPQARTEAAYEAAARFDLADRFDSRIGAMSGGMKRRALLARSTVHSPDVVLLDEPSVGLDPIQRIELRECLEQLSRTALVLISTHLIEDVAAVADTLLVLRDGTQVFFGPAGHLPAPASVPVGQPGLEASLMALLNPEAVSCA